VLPGEGQVMDNDAKSFRTTASDLSLGVELENADADAEQAWAAEVQRRSAAYAHGETESRDWRESVQRVRQLLAKNRSV
jgi:hypothetical protein